MGSAGSFSSTITLDSPTVPGNVLVAVLSVGNSFYTFDASFVQTVNSYPLYAGYKSIVSSANNSFTYTANTNSVVVLAEISDVNAAASTYSSGAITYAGSVASAGSVVPSASTLLLTAFSNGNGSSALSFTGATPVGNSILVQGNASGSFNPASLVLTDYFGSGATITPGITASASSPSGNNTYAFLQLMSAGTNANATLTANLPVAQVGTTTQSVGTLNAGANISFSGIAPNLTIAASTTASANITIEQAGTSIGTVGTINFPAISVAGGVATVNLSDQLDAEFSSTQGAVLYRDASAWKALGPGTLGQVLQTGGAGANPSWVAQSGGAGAVTLVFAQTVSGVTEVDFVSLLVSIIQL